MPFRCKLPTHVAMAPKVEEGKYWIAVAQPASNITTNRLWIIPVSAVNSANSLSTNSLRLSQYNQATVPSVAAIDIKTHDDHKLRQPDQIGERHNQPVYQRGRPRRSAPYKSCWNQFCWCHIFHRGDGIRTFSPTK